MLLLSNASIILLETFGIDRSRRNQMEFYSHKV